MAASYVRFTEARQKLVRCRDFVRLREARHQLADGVVLTSVSDVPFEMSFKCTQCAEVFWFENLSWREGGFTQWCLNTEHHECVPPATMRIGTDYALRMHP
jgi:hypothetical protein